MKYLFTIISILTICTVSSAQSNSCPSLSITSIYPDTINPANYLVAINFSASPNTFINYPYISALLDCNGDTVADGYLFWFGQLGQSTQEYPITVSGSLNCQPLTAVFIFGTDSGGEDTCFLSFINTEINEFSDLKSRLDVYPVPASDILNIRFQESLLGKKLTIEDMMGKQVSAGVVNSTHMKIELENLPNGLYLLKVNDNLNHVCRFIKN